MRVFHKLVLMPRVPLLSRPDPRWSTVRIVLNDRLFYFHNDPALLEPPNPIELMETVLGMVLDLNFDSPRRMPF